MKLVIDCRGGPQPAPTKAEYYGIGFVGATLCGRPFGAGTQARPYNIIRLLENQAASLNPWSIFLILFQQNDQQHHWHY